VQPWLTLDVGVVAELARGGTVAWNTASPRIAAALTPAGIRRLTLRAGYARLYAPLAGRYLDFGDPNSLGGEEYQWTDINHDGRYQAGETGPLIMRFGGPYSSIDLALRPPHADEVNLGAEVSAAWESHGSRVAFPARREGPASRPWTRSSRVGLPSGRGERPRSRRPAGDLRRSIARGVRAATGFVRPGRYLLTNPRGLSTVAEGVVTEAGGQWRGYSARASFMAVQSTGPTNPGNSPIENDPGAIGSLDADPNASINASGRQFFDRAYVGKAQFVGKLPRFLGGMEWENSVTYMDGAAFGGSCW